MPYETRKLGKYYVEVRKKFNGAMKAKKTTIEKAKKQNKVLQWKDHGHDKTKYL